MSKDNNVSKYGWGTTEGPCSCEYLIPVVSSLLKAFKGQRILDLGAGNGALCHVLHKQGHTLTGIDPDKEGIDMAQSSYPTIPFYCFGVEDDPSELLKQEDPFDVVISTEVVEHLYSPHLLPLYAKRVLNPGGHLIISTPYHGYFKNLVLSLLNKWDDHHTALWHGGHIKFWSPKTLSMLLDQNGFEVTRFLGAGRVPGLWKSMLLVAKKKA